VLANRESAVFGANRELPTDRECTAEVLRTSGLTDRCSRRAGITDAKELERSRWADAKLLDGPAADLKERYAASASPFSSSVMRAIHSILGLGATIAALSQCAQPADNVTDGNATPIIELRLASDTPRAGWARAELDGQPLYIAPSAVVSDDDIESVEPHLRPTQIVLDLQLRPEAYGRLHTATSQALGERIAVILNSEPLEAPRIRSP
jgi:hypothetical protein